MPLTLHGIDGRYATALYSAAAKKNALDKVHSDLETIQKIIEKEPTVKKFMETPLVDRAGKKEGVKLIMSKGSYSDLTKNFFEALAENGRLDQTTKVMAAFKQLMTASRGEVAITVTSAKELDAKMLTKVKDLLSAGTLFPKGSKLIVSIKVRPSLAIRVDFQKKYSLLD